MSYLPSQFDNDVQLLSTAKHIRDHVPTSSTIPSSHSEKHVKILDDIALSMTMKAKGDVTAVSSKLSQNCADIYFCKNSPTYHSLDSYFSEILFIIRSSDPTKREKLLLLVIKTCLEKVRSRIQKVQRRFPSTLNRSNSSPIPRSSHPRRKAWNNSTDGEIVTEELINIRELDLKIEVLRGDIHNITVLSRRAFSIGIVVLSLCTDEIIYLTDIKEC